MRHGSAMKEMASTSTLCSNASDVSSLPSRRGAGDTETRWWPRGKSKAVFRKILSTAKNKMGRGGAAGHIKYEGATAAEAAAALDADELARRKAEWQEELDEMSDFLQLKSTEEQRQDGVPIPVDTAFIDERDGLPVLKAVFDVHHFSPDDINLSVEGDQLVLEARALDNRDDRVYRKTMLRRVDLPKHAHAQLMHCELSPEGILTIEMPFHLPPQRRPHGPNVFPILQDAQGRRKIRLAFMVGPEFTSDDISVAAAGHTLRIEAGYEDDVGKYGLEKQARRLRRDYQLPDSVTVDAVSHVLRPDGTLHIEVTLANEKPFECQVQTEEVSDDS